MSELNLPVDGPVALADDDDWEDWRQGVVDSGACLIEVVADGSSAADSLFPLFAEAMALPSDVPIRKWSGLQDRLWEYLSGQESDTAVIAVRRTQGLLEGGLGDLLTLTSIFEDLARSVASTDTGFPREMSLIAVLTGFGTNFPAR